MDKETAKQNLKIVLEKYQKYKNSDALEHEANAEKIIEDIFEKVLGWESLEDYVKRKSQDTGKFPDYTFRLNGINKFFLEAKKIDASLDNISFQKQAIGYARSSSVSFAVLTNFIELRIYVVDREIDSSKNFEKSQLFKPILIENCLNESEFDKLWLLSKESFINKKIYEFAEENCKLTKRKEIGKHLSEKLNYLREKIKNSIKRNEKYNSKITSDINSKQLLDEVTQKILDRLVFIRVCEDREYENRHLESFLNSYKENKINLWKSVKGLFKDYDKKNEKTNVGGYDSGLFEYSLCDEVFLDENIIALVIEEFYYFDDGTPINFSKIPADVLGNLYENYLSYISKNADIQKSHKKEQGIFYTPTYIVDYIVKNTISELLKDKKVNVEKIKILDPACGSGSFLIKAFDVIEEYYKKDKNYNQKTLADDGTTYSTKERILKNNIFGVDLDAKAVEIAQLNLLLKIAEKGHRLPLLQQNIKRGNSLIDDENIRKADFFKWDDRFSNIIQYDKNGNLKEGFGFDVVIGNPPYIRNTELSEIDKQFFNNKYLSAHGQYDIFVLFFELGIKLLKNQGYLGFITSNKFIASDYGQKLRDLILKNCKIKCLIDVSNLKVFKDASTYPVIIILQKDPEKSNREDNIIIFQRIEDINDIYSKSNVIKIKQSKFSKSSDNRFLQNIENKKELIDKIDKNSSKIGEIFKCQRGSPKNKIKIVNIKSKQSLDCIVSKDVNNYYSKISDKFFIISELQNKILLKEKILIPRTVLSLKAAYEEGGHFIMDRIYYLIPNEKNKLSIKFVVGLLNSKLIDFYYKINFGTTHVGGGYLDLRGTQIRQLPIKNTSLSQQCTLIQFVDKILSLNKRLSELGDNPPSEKTKELREQIEKVTEQINEEVYKLYGITKEEQKIIEESLKQR